MNHNLEIDFIIIIIIIDLLTFWFIDLMVYRFIDLLIY